MAPMEKAPVALKARFAAVMDASPDVERRQMFGYPCSFVNGQLFTGLFGSGWMVRLGEDERRQLIEEGATRFEPMPGRPMREYVLFPTAMVDDDAALHRWLRMSLEYARALPPKEPKPRKRTASKRPG
jgi:TfoX/Sxy family transcriptional regulator of competence genes